MSKTVSELISCPNNAWRLFQRDGVYYADGRRNRLGKHSLNTRNRSDAIRLVIELDGRAGRDEVRPSVDTGSASASVPVAIQAGWDRYIECRKIPIHLGGLKNSSIRKYRTHQKRFAAYCQNKRIECWSNVTRGVLEAYATSLDGKLAPVTVHDDLTMEISVSNWLIKEGWIPPTCCIDWKLQKPPGAEQYCYDRVEVKRMLQVARALKFNRWLFSTILLLGHTGMRVGEAQNLKWTDIDFTNEVLHVRDESFSKKMAA